MNSNMLFDSLKEVVDNENKSKRKEPSYIYLDEKDNQIKEIALSKFSDSAGSVYINCRNPAKLIHKAIFGY
jgi:hypothetical protein